MDSNYKKTDIKNEYYDDFIKTLPSLSGRTMAITGTTSGTGYVAAQTVARKGARVILLNRPSERADDSFDKLKKNSPEAELLLVECDLQSFDSVRKASEEVRKLSPKGLDVLCNNAGVMALKDRATSDGFDVQMQTNHLSHFLLTKELFSSLEKAVELRGEARIVNHSSVARMGAKELDGKYLDKNGGNLGGDCSRMIFFPQGRWKRYSQTKLANATFTSCLHDKLQKNNSNIKALVAHPGLSATNLQNTTVKDGGMGSWFTGLLMKSAQTKEDGAIGIIKCMADENVNSGDFIGPGSGDMPRSKQWKGPVIAFPLESYYNNKKTRDLLWSKSCEAIGEDFNI